VTGIDAITNTVVVGRKSEVYHCEFLAQDMNWISIDGLDDKMRLKARIRYRHPEMQAEISPAGEFVRVVFDEAQMAITPGQSVVLYDGIL